MFGSSKSGRFHSARSIRWSLAGGWGSVDKEELDLSIVWITKAAIWGQTRGCLEEQRMTAIEGGVRGDMTIEELVEMV